MSLKQVQQVAFPQRGEMAELVASRDWSTTSIGHPDAWPASFRTILRTMLTSRYAMWLGWGPDLLFFYNDAYGAATLGKKHPWALGRPAREVWAEIWGALSPRIDTVLKTGESTWDEGLLLFLERSGFPEETYHTFSYSPLPTDDGHIGGMFCVVVEETERVIAERQISVLRDLASALSHTNTTQEVVSVTEQCLRGEQSGIPFSLIYLFDAERNVATLAATTHLTVENHDAAPSTISLDDPSSSSSSSSAPWPLHAIFDGSAEAIDFALDDKKPWPKGRWPKTPTRAAILPISQQGQTRPAGAVIVGLNPHRTLDDGYRSFLALIVGQIAAGLSNARAYEAAEQRAEALAQLDRAKTVFFSNVSHEFRTPLTLMLGPTEDALASADRVLRGEDLEIVHRNELRLLKLVNTLLDFSRIEAGRIQATYEPTDLATLTAELASVFRSAIERVSLQLIVDTKPLSSSVFVDHDMWEKIILNLLSNALKFTFDGEIRVSVHEEEGHAVVRVNDTGTGVPPNELPHLFERFHRVQGAKARTHEGSGIGLALVSELVKLHGGTATVESTENVGTTFTLRIPLGKAHLPADRIVASSSSAASSSHAAHGSALFIEEALRWGGETGAAAQTAKQRRVQTPVPISASWADRPHVLLADDNADMREYVTRLLSDHWRVTTAADGQAALEVMSRDSDHVDLVISDVMMPGIDGFELIRRIRSKPSTRTTPIILLSARAGDEAVAEGLRSGADDYLVKPFAASSLVVRVEAQLAAARSRAALQKQTETERERLRAMFDVSPAAIAVIRGRDLVIELANNNIIEVWGKTKEILGKKLLEGVPELQGQGFDALLLKVLDTGIPHHGNAVVVRLDRQRTGVPVEVYFDFVYAPMRDADGSIRSVFVHAFDVTELVTERRAAETANRMKDEFLATMSHELRTPLNAILGWASLLQTRDLDSAARAKAIVTIERNARSQARLIEDVLDVSRIISGKLRLNIQRVNVPAVIQAAVDVVRPAMDAKGLNLRVLIGEESGVISGDAERLQQVVWNLLINATRFTPTGGSISIDVRRVMSGLRLTVTDSGAGIAPEHLPHVFERFRQADSSPTRKHSGLGLGLAIVRHIVELHGGTVIAESAGLGHGATLTVSLPIRAVHATASEDSDTQNAIPAPAHEAVRNLTGIRALVTDDDEDSRELVAAALAGAGASVRMADSAATAMKEMTISTFDVLVSDIGMPDEDGYSLVRRVRDLPPPKDAKGRLVAIALTAYARKEDEILARNAGYDHHIAKPVDPERLVETVYDYVAKAIKI